MCFTCFSRVGLMASSMRNVADHASTLAHARSGPGDIVMAKVKGYPAWPGVVSTCAPSSYAGRCKLLSFEARRGGCAAWRCCSASGSVEHLASQAAASTRARQSDAYSVARGRFSLADPNLVAPGRRPARHARVVATAFMRLAQNSGALDHRACAAAQRLCRLSRTSTRGTRATSQS